MTYERYPFKEIGSGSLVFSGFAFKSKDFSEEGIPVVKIRNVNNRVVNLSEVQYFPENKVSEKHSKFFLEDKDILIAMTGQGSVGRVGRISLNDGKSVLLNQRVGKFVTDEKNINKDYLYYVLSSPMYEQILFDTGTGSGQPNLSPKLILQTEIPLPPYDIQLKIGKILSSLDEKIELNHKMNQTLEEIGQAIFKHWFVHFEFPDDEGKPYKSSGGEMVDSELGDIPSGWEVVDLNTVCDITSSKRIYHKEYVEEGIPFYRSKEIIQLSKNQQVESPLFISKDRYSELSSKFGAPKTGDLLMTSVGTLGIPYMVKSNEKFYFKDGNLMWFKSFKKGFSNIYLYYWIISKRGQQKLDEISIGSTQRALTIDSLKRTKFVLPLNDDNGDLFTKFSAVMKSIFTQINVLNEENRNLSQIRDSLLPKLMSGKIRIPLEDK